MAKFILLFILSFAQLAYAQVLKRTLNLPLMGVHGMSITSQGIMLTDTFKSSGASESWLYLLDDQNLKRLNFKGVGLAGIAEIGSGYLICDLHGSFIYQTNKNLKIEKQWAVLNPWNARMSLDGKIFAITQSGQFILLNLNGTVTELIQNLDAPFDFAFDVDQGGVWITEQGQKDGRVSLWKQNTGLKFTRTVDSQFKWKNPEGIVYSRGFAWVLDTELRQLVKVSTNGMTQSAAQNLGIPILIKEFNGDFVVLSNNFQNGPKLLTLVVP
jgi:hypothetical protein